jgi:cell division protein FtsZ
MESLLQSVTGKTTEESEGGPLERIKIVVAGVGGGGNNSLQRMLRWGIKGADLVAINTDNQHLQTLDERIQKILVGKSITKGLGAGGFIDVGRKAAEVDRPLIERALKDSQLVFICAGMGGGTGTGGAPVVAQVAKEQGAITVAMVTYPFALEKARKTKADEGIQELRKYCDSVIIVDNNKLVELVPNLPMNEAFAVADEILARAVGGLVWTITQPSLINIDFADVRAIMGSGDVGFIAVGEGKGTNKVEAAAEGVLKNKLLDVEFEGARGALIHISGGADLTLGDAIKAGEIITEKMDPQANVKWGARLIPGYDGKIEIVSIVTGVKGASVAGTPLKEKEALPVYSDIDIIG